eukprot:14979878-Alexandrium_andersonii.AAC.1
MCIRDSAGAYLPSPLRGAKGYTSIGAAIRDAKDVELPNVFEESFASGFVHLAASASGIGAALRPRLRGRRRHQAQPRQAGSRR